MPLALKAERSHDAHVEALAAEVGALTGRMIQLEGRIVAVMRDGGTAVIDAGVITEFRNAAAKICARVGQ